MEITGVPTSWVAVISRGGKNGTWKVVSVQYTFYERLDRAKILA